MPRGLKQQAAEIYEALTDPATMPHFGTLQKWRGVQFILKAR